MTREEHIEWCKERAMREMDFTHDPKQGIISMMSDLRKHPETNSEALIMLCMAQLLTKELNLQQVVNFLNGFN